MTAMFQEEVAKMAKANADLNEQVQAKEREQHRVAGLLSAERQKTDKLETQLAEAKIELNQLGSALAEKTRMSEQLSNVEQEAIRTHQQIGILEREKQALGVRLADSERKCAEVSTELKLVSSALKTALTQIEPLGTLVIALKEREHVEAVIREQLNLLDIGSSD